MQWRMDHVPGSISEEIVNSTDGDAYEGDEIRTLQLAETSDYAVVSWVGKPDVWECWEWNGEEWAYVSEFSTATAAKANATGRALDTKAGTPVVEPEPKSETGELPVTVDVSGTDEVVVDKAAPEPKPVAKKAPEPAPEPTEPTEPEPESPPPTATEVSPRSTDDSRTQRTSDQRIAAQRAKDAATIEAPNGPRKSRSVVWRGKYYGNPPISVPHTVRKRIQAVADGKTPGGVMPGSVV